MSKQLTTEEFISKARTIHGDLYDYSKVQYKNSYTKVTIVCKIHGSFQQKPNSHLIGKGCRQCGGTNPLTQEQVISKCREVHGDRYDYSKVIYIGAMRRIEIICKEHGSFWQIFVNHINGSGCKKCFKNHLLTQEEFIQKAKEVHGDLYDYSYAVYKDGRSKISIVCKNHGSFEQKASSHIQGIGCRKCGGTHPLTQDEFIDKAKEVHGDRYDYSKAEYKNYTTKVSIICKQHGSFVQKPADHLSGKGCFKCSSSKREILISKILADNNILFVPQKTFEDCRNKKLLPFDFYIPSKNTLIEYDGELHYKPFRYARSAEEKLRKVQRNDTIKTKYCQDNNIPLIRIPYWKTNEEIRETIHNLIS